MTTLAATARPIYLDYAATTPVDPRVVQRMVPYLYEQFGNPASRSHAFGWAAEEAVEIAREHVAALIGADPREIAWTSGATESNNLAIKGAALFHQAKGRHLITLKTEHKAVLDTMRELERAGFEAATNIVVKDAWRTMLALVYAAVALLCFVTFRSWRAVLVAVLPLMLTSALAEALMVALGMGVKVATLPVIALGVGIGVDYALYILSVTLANLREGRSLSESYYRALLFTGKVVLLTGVTLAIGVITWVASPIKFQADMGLLLAFMFLWNMLGALVLLPALGHFLLKRQPIAAETSAAFYGALKAHS